MTLIVTFILNITNVDYVASAGICVSQPQLHSPLEPWDQERQTFYVWYGSCTNYNKRAILYDFPSGLCAKIAFCTILPKGATFRRNIFFSAKGEGEVVLLTLTYFDFVLSLCKARSIWYSGGGGGLGFFSKKNSLLWFWLKKNNLAQRHCEKNNLSPIVTQNSLTGMFEMSKSKNFSGSLRSPVEYQIQIVFKC